MGCFCHAELTLFLLCIDDSSQSTEFTEKTTALEGKEIIPKKRCQNNFYKTHLLTVNGKGT